MILSLDSPYASLHSAGGKGVNLARLIRAGLPVPPGFIVTTEAYNTFVEVNDLQETIGTQLHDLDPEQPDGLQTISVRIRTAFEEGAVPLLIESALREAHLPYESKALAVRSSATAEDLPDSSFAGQQDTFLNVQGYEALRSAVIGCWSSLWTARAIAYRARNRIPQQTTALAVVVQVLVEAETSGVMFTANPLTGVRSQTVIDATFGLGEALVSGMIEPDHFVVETRSSEIVTRKIGAKAIRMQSAPSGGLKHEEKDRSGAPALTDDQIHRLAAFGARISDLYDFPQDIEWAAAGDEIFILQSRPITSLFPRAPLPEDPLHALFSFGAVQGMLDPITPFGRDIARMIIAGGGRLLGFDASAESQQAVFEAGERLWLNITPALRSGPGRRLLQRAAGLIEPETQRIIERLTADPRLKVTSRGIHPRSALRLARLIAAIAGSVLSYLLSPERTRRRKIRRTDRWLSEIAARARSIGGEPHLKFKRRVELVERMYDAFPMAVPTLFAGAGAGLAASALINRLAARSNVPEAEVLRLSRGLPNNVTTEMDLSLWEVARSIRGIREDLDVIQLNDAKTLAARYLENRLPIHTQTATAEFLERYGARGYSEIDFGRPRWKDNPAGIFRTIKQYLKIPPEQAPDKVFGRGAEAARHAADRIRRALLSQPGGRLHARLFDWAYARFRALAGLRESPKFFVIRLMTILRDSLLASAADLVKQGRLQERSDIFFLTFAETRAAAHAAPDLADLHQIVRERKARYERELERKQVPRIMLSDGEVFYDAAGTGDESGSGWTGSPVSPGSVEARARIVLDPQDARLEQGEILVCRGTDPAWTPLFLIAGGLVMEVGGMMTHGAVVAREYGIPAVVGVANAVKKIETGMMIRLDGSTGTIERLD